MSPRALLAVTLAAAVVAPAVAAAQTWVDVTADTIGPTAEWTNKVELADVDGDGHLDILLANGGDYDTGGEPEPLRVFAGDGAGDFTEITATVFGGASFLARAVKVRDVTGDQLPDVLVVAGHETQSRLFVADGLGGFTDRTADLPAGPRSFGDGELGDVDDDGDLDVLLADWGPGPALTNGGGQPRLWLNDGAGGFTDATADRLPTMAIGMSWELELADVDNDRDLDALIACKVCDGSVLLRNGGGGTFADASAALPQFGNNYEFELMDLDGDDRLDTVTINDGLDFREHVFAGDGTGFVDRTAAWWAADDNTTDDDNAIAFLDVDADGDADFLIGSLSGDDRVLINDGDGHLSLGPQGFDSATGGTLGIAVGDLDEDGRLEVVNGQGEAAFPDHVYSGAALPIDDVAPSVVELDPISQGVIGTEVEVVARIHDFHSPVRPTDFTSIELVIVEGDAERRAPMSWYGESLFRARLVADGDVTVACCAVDAQGNEACSAPRPIAFDAGGGDGGPGGDDAGPGAEGGGGGCGCRTGSGTTPGALGLGLVALAGLLGQRRRRARR